MVNYKKELLSHGFIFYINVIHSFLVSNSLFSKGKKYILLFYLEQSKTNVPQANRLNLSLI